MMKLVLIWTALGKEDQELLPLQRITPLELPASDIPSWQHLRLEPKSNYPRVQVEDTSPHQLGRLHESGLMVDIAAKKPLLRETNKKRNIAWIKKQKDWTLDQWKRMIWPVSLWDAEKVNGWYLHVWLPAWRMEEVWWCGGALLVLASYSEFKEHLTSMATASFCSNMSSHLVPPNGTITFFSTGQWPKTHLQSM